MATVPGPFRCGMELLSSALVTVHRRCFCHVKELLVPNIVKMGEQLLQMAVEEVTVQNSSRVFRTK